MPGVSNSNPSLGWSLDPKPASPNLARACPDKWGQALSILAGKKSRRQQVRHALARFPLCCLEAIKPIFLCNFAAFTILRKEVEHDRQC